VTVALPHAIATSRLVLRRSSSAYAARAFAIRQNWNVGRNLSSNGFPPEASVMAAWFGSHEDEWDSGTAYRFAILRDAQMIGLIDISAVHDGVGELGYWLDEADWGQGYGLEAGQAVMRFAFDEVALAALVAGHAADNAASGRLLAKLGFVSVGDAVIFSKSRAAEIVQRRLRLGAEQWRRDGAGRLA
jgi:RimJ/RimL family protein N-acetyltransferase